MAITKLERVARAAVPERLSAFGLDVRVGASNGSGGRARAVSWELVDAAAALGRARLGRAETLVDFRFEDGRPMLSIEHELGVGYRIWAPRFGRHVVSDDGRLIRSALPRLAAWRWQRLFYAQVLPLASALQGLELFHASAVRIEGEAVALVAASGTGKTSTAAHLVAAGAALVTDDVLALERVGPHVRAYPGAGMMSVDPAELGAMSAAGRSRLGSPIGRDEKVHLAARPVAAPLPLAAIYFLRRVGEGSAVRIAGHDEPPTRRLLGSSFLAYLRSAERLVTHLDVCASVVESVPTFDVLVPETISARDVAQALDAHARERAAG